MTDPSIQTAPSWRRQVDRRANPFECWPWTGPVMSNGYGQTRIKKDGRWRGAGAHQVAYYLAYGIWEQKADRRLVRHLCHNRLCCNPRHLRGGDANDNAADLVARRQGVDLLPNPFILPVVGIARDHTPSAPVAEASE